MPVLLLLLPFVLPLLLLVGVDLLGVDLLGVDECDATRFRADDRGVPLADVDPDDTALVLFGVPFGVPLGVLVAEPVAVDAALRLGLDAIFCCCDLERFSRSIVPHSCSQRTAKTREPPK